MNEHAQKIKKTRAKIRMLEHEIEGLEFQLTEISEVAIRVFNEMSEPIDGVTIDRVALGSRSCVETENPLGICVFCEDDEEAMSIPGQIKLRAWRKEHRGMADEYHCPSPDDREMMTDACLFCGLPGELEE